MALAFNAVKILRRLALERIAPDAHLQTVNRIEPLDARLSGSVDCFRRTIEPFRAEFKWSLSESYNGYFEPGDIEFYYSIIRSIRPKTIIEVGCGWATRVALRAIDKNGAGRMLCIDPAPRYVLPQNVEFRKAFVEDVELDFFDQLEAGDILFIDSSHTRAEAEYHVKFLLPRLKPGVFVHHHDVFYPYASLFGEEEVLREFYKGENCGFELLCGLSFVRERDPGLCRSLLSSFGLFANRTPGSLWSRKIR
jgi:predicted O-methyltransferase YrrM